MTPRTTRQAAALTALALLLGAAPAAAQDAAPRTTAAGGVTQTPVPSADAVTCRTGCAGIDRAQVGSTVRITGEDVAAVRYVAFLGRKGRRDDRTVPATVVPGAAAVEAVVPKGARTGQVRLVTAEKLRSKPTRSRLRVVRATAAAAPRVQARVDSRRVYVGGGRPAAVSYFVGGTEPAAVAIQLTRRSDGQAVASWPGGVVQPGTVASVAWDGTLGGAPAPEGRYDFTVVAVGGQQRAQAAQAGPPSSRASFLLVGHRFPVAGPHTYGGFAASFGGGRGHEGQDVFAACGTPLVAAIGGTVKHVAFQSRAGNYLVIAGTDGFDHAYMHLQAPTPLKKGQAVTTGQPIGAVGDTGRASGCHLHFEMWSAPGWYTGGTAVDPLPYLKSWDG